MHTETQKEDTAANDSTNIKAILKNDLKTIVTN